MTGRDFKDKRISLGYTQAELAEKLGYNIRTIQLWEAAPYKAVPRVVVMAMWSVKGKKIKALS